VTGPADAGGAHRRRSSAPGEAPAGGAPVAGASLASDPDARPPSMSAALVPRARPHWLVNDGILLAVAVVGGLAHAVLLLGWPVINPLNLEWLKGDPAAHYLGWAFYRHERHWGFPLTWTTRLGYPVGVSIAFQDSIPLIAIPLRWLSPILPEPFQYLGLYATLALVLQMYFGLLLCRRLCNAHPLFTYAGGVLILLAPVLTRRLHGHFALASHWLVLASLWACVRATPTPPIVRALWPFFVLLVVAGAIHPYLAAQGLLIALAAAARVILLDRSRWKAVVGVSLLLGGALALSLTVSGFLGSLEWSAYRSEGFGLFSLNLLGPFNPTGLAHLLPELPVAHPFQRFEGYSYLGAGIIAVLLVTLVVHRRRVLSLFGRADVRSSSWPSCARSPPHPRPSPWAPMPSPASGSRDSSICSGPPFERRGACSGPRTT